MTNLTFRAASDILLKRITTADIAGELGVEQNTVARARMDSGSPNARSAPPGWEAAVSKLARKRARELDKLADRLERA